MDHLIKPSRICVFCYKSENGDKPFPANNQSNSLLHVNKFLKFLYRFTNGKCCGENFSEFNLPGCIGCCGNCFGLIDEFCKDFHQFKCLELKLEYKVGQLVNVMKFGGRVPSRVTKLREAFNNPSNVQNSKSGNLDENCGRLLSSVKRFRKRVIKNCATKLSKSQPRIPLKRCTEPVSTVPILRDAFLDKETGSSENLDNGGKAVNVPLPLVTFLGWLFSFSAVIVLLQPGCRKTCHQDACISPYSNVIEETSPDDDKFSTLYEKVVTYYETEDREEFPGQGELEQEPIEENSDQDQEIGPIPDFEGNNTRNFETYSDNGDGPHLEETASTLDEMEIETPIVIVKTETSPISVQEERKQKESQLSHKWIGGRTLSSNFKCSTCDKRFRNGLCLRQHEKTVHVSHTHECFECGKMFKAASQLNRHRLIHKDPSTWKLKCTHCTRRFYSKSNLNLHIATNHKEKSPTDLVNDNNNDGQDISSSFPSFPIVSVPEFQVVQIANTEDDDSGSRDTPDLNEESLFLDLDVDKEHQKSARRLKSGKISHRSQCPICEKWMYTKNMAQHRRIHTGEKPYSCQICSVTFSQKSCYNAHMQRKHNVKAKGLAAPTIPFKCHLCGKEMKYKGNLYSHLRMRHKISTYAIQNPLVSL